MSRHETLARLLANRFVQREVRVLDRKLVVPPGVLDPVLFRSGAWFAEQVRERLRPGSSLLDLGCGTGVVGVLSGAARVVACDIDERACSAARLNGLLDVRQGDLFAPVRGERFDTVCFNPPYLDHPVPVFRRALFGGWRQDVVRRFAAHVGDHIAPGGQALVVLSGTVHSAVPALGPGWTRLAEQPIEGELLLLLGRSSSP